MTSAPVPTRQPIARTASLLLLLTALAALPILGCQETQVVARVTADHADAFARTVLVPPPPRRPNIVLILADDLGRGDLGCFGAADIATPNIDRLAVEGTRFTDFSVAQAVCTASRAAILSGCYPNRIGMAGALNHTSTTGIHRSERLLSESLKAAGYRTAIHGKWHLGHRPPFLPTARGFDDCTGLPYSNDNGPLHPVIRGIPALPWYVGDGVGERDPDQSTFTRRITESAERFIEENANRPFFLYLPHIMPHVPIAASEKFRNSGPRGLYGDAVRELDWAVGQVLAALKKHHLDDDTLVIFTSDNGPFLSYGSHAGSAGGLREGKLTAYEGGTRMPFLARWPGRIPPGKVSDLPLAGMDLFPTLAALAGATWPTRIDGLDLTDALLGRPGAKGRPTMFYYSGDELHAVRRGGWKLHLAHDYLTVAGEPGRDGKPSEFGRLKPLAIEQSGIRGIASRHGYRVERQAQALYDLTADLAETTDVSAQRPEIVAELLTLAEEARADLGDAITGAKGRGRRPVGTDP